jgi:hypothetical protein
MHRRGSKRDGRAADGLCEGRAAGETVERQSESSRLGTSQARIDKFQTDRTQFQQ